MKTAEELNALKEEIDTLNKKLAELTNEELEQVAGSAGAGEGTIDITIRDLSGRDSYFTVSPVTTIYRLKWLWNGGTAVDETYVPYTRLIYMGKEMDNSRTVASYNIPSGTKIHVIFKIR